jgi:hypothetical protein
MFRKNSLGVSVLVLALVLTASAPVFAKIPPHGLIQGQEPGFAGFPSFELNRLAGELRKHGLRVRLPDTVLLGTPLQAGEYTISWESHRATATVTVSRKNDVLATVEGKLVERGKKHNRDAILLGTNADGKKTIREIHLSGSSQAIVFYE